MEDQFLVQDGLVEQLHALLSEALRRTRPDAFGAPVTVAEIYQDLVPYRHVRSLLGFQMNADYEHTLLRMLSGEAGLTRLEPETARDELRAELDTPNPNVGLFRKFAACDVWVEPSTMMMPESEIRLEPLRPEPPPPPPAPLEAAPPPAPMPLTARMPLPEPIPLPEPMPLLEPVPLPEPDLVIEDVRLEADDELVLEEVDVQEPASPALVESQWQGDIDELLLEEEVEDATVEVPPALPETAKVTAPRDRAVHSADQRASGMLESNPRAQASIATAAGGSCAFCTKSLPGGRTVRFCPHCGMDQSFTPCQSCREPLEPGWTFCIACGSRQQ